MAIVYLVAIETPNTYANILNYEVHYISSCYCISANFVLLKPNQEVTQPITKKSNKITLLSQRLGISTFSTTISKQEGIISTDIAAKKMNINGFDVNLNNAKFAIESKGAQTRLTLTIEQSSSIQLDLRNEYKQIYYAGSNSPIKFESLSEKEATRIMIALVLYNEMMNPGVERQVSKNRVGEPELNAGCDRTIMTIYSTRSAATDHLKTTTDQFLKAHPDCFKVHGVDSGCLWGDYGCVATQEIHCNGGGCDVPYGRI